VSGEADCDAVIIGSGPGGGTAADILTAAGWSVIVLEKGRNHLVDLEPPYALKGDFSNDEIKFASRYFLGPDPLIEPRTFRRSEDDGDRVFSGVVNNLPSTVGGGAVHADAKMPRFREVDFRLLSELGPIDGASVVDWPMQYDEMEPYYAEAERLIGVAGEPGNPFASWRSGPFPMPPGADMYAATLSAASAERLGLHPYRAPTGVNSVPYDGRPACVNCGFCGRYGCPIHAKGDPVASLRRALQTGRCEIRPETVATSILLDRTGRRARGVAAMHTSTRNTSEVTGRFVVVGCGGFETPRLLLRSGVGNSSSLVGRYLMYHFQTFVTGSFPFSLHPHRGRTVTHHHDDFLVPGPDDLAAARDAGLPYFRGGTVEHGGGGQPVLEASIYRPGPEHTSSMQQSPMRDRMWAFTMQGEDMPQITNRVDLDPTVRDVWGMAAGRVTYSPHKHDLVASAHYAPKLDAVMRGAGAEWTVHYTSPPLPEMQAAFRGDGMGRMGIAPHSHHVMGTARMGDDPRASVVDRFGRFHDVDNLVCVDSSVFPTSTGYNPTLTIVALAIRAARALCD
jgi:gluconate 2-dehydrogenase alpha chain